MDMIQKAVALGNSNGKRFLALEYISGKHIEQDIDKDKSKELLLSIPF